MKKFTYAIVNEYEQEFTFVSTKKLDLFPFMGRYTEKFGLIIYAAEYEDGRIVEEWEY